MLILLLVLLALTCLALGLRLYALERDIRACARQLRSGRPRVSMAAPNAAAEELLTEELLRQIYDTQLLVRYSQELGRRVCLYPPL